MAHNTRTRVDVVAWSSGAVLPSEIDHMDTLGFQSINGDLGGVWAPSDFPITIGGHGLLVTGLLEIQGVGLLVQATAQFQNTVQILNTLTVTGGLVTANAGAHILGAPLTVDSAAAFNGIADFEDDVTVHTSAFLLVGGSAQLGNDSSKTLDVEATATFNAPATFNDTIDFFDAVVIHSAGGLINAGPATFNGSADFNGSANFDGSIVANGTVDFWDGLTLHGSTGLIVNGDSVFNHAVTLGTNGSDAVDVPGTMNLHEPLTYSFSGRVPRRPLIGAGANSTYGIPDANEIHVPNGTLPANTTYILSTNGAKEGDEFVISTLDNAHFLQVSVGAATATIRAGGATIPSWCRFVLAGGIWRLVELNTP